jgi:hypothetical protein
MVFRTRVIVRLGTQNRMVTKGYRKGVYDRVTLARVGATVLAHAHLDRTPGPGGLNQVQRERVGASANIA